MGLTDVRGQYETLAVTPTAIAFENIDDNYVYTGSAANGTYSVKLRNGSYIASITLEGYSTSTHVVVKDGAVERDLLLKAEPKAIAYKDTVYVGSDKEFKSFQAAVNAAANMTRSNGERVTIKIDPGVYREQVVVNTPSITIESNGGTKDNTKITWYYGIGYKYYSVVDSYYDPYADYDKFEKGNVVKYWGSAVGTNTFQIPMACAGKWCKLLSGEYIFTIDKNGKFTAKNKALVEQPYWSEYGQNLFNSIGGKAIEPVKEVTLNFATDDALALYVTNAATTYTDGIYTGEYTNADGQSFDVSVYQSGIQYYNSTAHYGTKLTPNKPIFSFTPNEKGMYTITVTDSTGQTTAGLYKDEACTEAVVTGTVGGTLVYKKATNTAETLYFGTTVAGNTYVSDVTITKADLPADVKVLFKGEVSGVESDDTNVVITLKGSTETLTVNADDYTQNGLELIVGETYSVTAAGDKGVYLGTDIVTDDSGVANIILSRLIFDFKLDFIENFDDYNSYLNMTNAAAAGYTDKYSDITIHRNGVLLYSQYKQYGAKTNSNDIVSFIAKQTGVCNVTVDVSVSNADKLILKVNDVYAPVLTNASGQVTLSVLVNKGDKVTLYTPTRSNLWYKSIDVSYTDGAFMYENKVVDGSEMLVYGGIEENCLDIINKVGICLSAGLASAIDDSYAAIESGVVYSALAYNGEQLTSNGKKLFGTLVADVADGTPIYVYTYVVNADGTKVYSAPVEVSAN